MYDVVTGQGNTENLIEELVELDQVYRPLCRDFMLDVTKHLAEAASDPISKDYMSKGFDLVNWVDNIESRPPKEYLFTAAVSLPLVGLIQLMSYYITCRILSMTPGELRDRFVGATGHSQGIVAAAVISLSTTEDQLRENTAKALQSLFWMGLRAQQAYPETTLSPTILADSIAHGEGRPTPMLAVFNITLPVLQAQVDISNKFLVPEQKIEISLHNGTRAYVCSGMYYYYCSII
jgi:malonyl CoA-acyl carrier protein transacylase